MEKYLRIKTNGQIDEVQISPKTWLEDVYKSLSCRCIEAPAVCYNGWELLMICDGEGLLVDEPKVNHIASYIYNPQYIGYIGATICGDVLIAKQGYRAGEPDIVPLNDRERIAIHSALQSLTDALQTVLCQE